MAADSYHHPNISLLIPIDLHGVVHHQIHELVKSSKGANNNTVCIHLDWRKEQSVHQDFNNQS